MLFFFVHILNIRIVKLTSFFKGAIMNTRKALIIFGIATSLVSGVAMADYPKNYGYLVDTDGNIVKNHYGECWHTGYWKPDMAVAECDFVKTAEAETVPATEPVSAPATASPQKISISAEALFDFDKSTLKPAGKASLDDLVRNLDTAKYTEIEIVGNADRIGSDEYNQRLSERRADSVKAYLVSKDVPANLINAKGVGETQPVTKPGECAGPKSPAIIRCLQPDRRVDVTVSAAPSQQ